MTDTKIPPLIAGPMLRRLTTDQVTFWMACREVFPLRVLLWSANGEVLFERELAEGEDCHTVRIGTACVVQLITLSLEQPLPQAQRIDFDIQCYLDGGWQGLATLAPNLLYAGQQRPCFSVKSNLDSVLHGSCRKPHFPGGDGLLIADQRLADTDDPADRPALLMLSGDQVYADDVAGPMLGAIHQVIDVLGLFDEKWDGALVADMTALRAHPCCFYQREKLLPTEEASEDVLASFFGGVRKPIFTAAGAHNHLISLSEVLAMYLLTWSEVTWQWIDWAVIRDRIPTAFQARFDQELNAITAFAEGMPRVRRVLAQLPVYMIFDDHDITDDWNLTRAWEETAYGHPFSRRIIGNALIAYALCQGWGNAPRRLQPLIDACQRAISEHGVWQQGDLIDQCVAWDQWHYQVPTQPLLVVVDTRTHRWRSESSPYRPSGLMDWESLSELQQTLIGERAVMLVSPTPVYGVKFIEVVQRVFTFFGKALMVDAENWMAHPGAANVILNIFRHQKTPPEFFILSGDVHYSFAYDVTLRSRRRHNHILQITASGIKNAFPARLLVVFDWINQRLFGARSILNWLTKRRHMRISHRSPQPGDWRTLVNASGLGEVILGDSTETTQVLYHTVDGQRVTFKP